MIDTATATEPQTEHASNDPDHAHPPDGTEFDSPSPRIEMSHEIEDILAGFEMDYNVEGNALE